jgi:hypothetical protein
MEREIREEEATKAAPAHPGCDDDCKCFEAIKSRIQKASQARREEWRKQLLGSFSKLGDFQDLDRKLHEVDKRSNMTSLTKYHAKAALRESYYRRFLPKYTSPPSCELKLPGLDVLLSRFPSYTKNQTCSILFGKGSLWGRDEVLFLNASDQPLLMRRDNFAPPNIGTHSVVFLPASDSQCMVANKVLPLHC